MTPNIDCYRVLAAVYIGVVLKAMYIYIYIYIYSKLHDPTVTAGDSTQPKPRNLKP